MFEVDWTDYNSERVGQRRARKEIEKDLKKKDDSRSAHDSVITRSSSSSGDRHFGILESIGLKKTISATPKPKKSSALAIRTIKNDDRRQRNSICAPPSSKVLVHESCVSSGEEISPKSAPPVTENFTQTGIQAPWRSTTDPLPHDLPLPKPLNIVEPASTAQHSGVATDSTPMSAKVIQSLGPDSFITKTTEMSYEPRKETDTNTAVAGISIAAHHQMPQSPAPSSPPLSPVSIPRDMSVSVMIDKWFTAVHSDSPSTTFGDDLHGKSTPSSPAIRQQHRSPTGTPTRSPRKRPFALTPPSRASKISSSAGSPDAWKPPDAWNCSPAPGKPLGVSKSLRRVSDQASASTVSLDLDAMKREIKKMAVACPQSILVKLNEEWGTAPDAGFYKRLEMERKRWMLSALNSMHNGDRSPDNVGNVSPGEQKVLSLFESQSTTAYLAAFYEDAKITHLAPSPLSHILFPNVQPLFSPINPALPLATNSFTSVHCLALPSIMRSQDIPLLLDNIHRCLAPRGELHLNLIDPIPVAKSLGPRMREWFDQNLLLNLEKNFRCMHPCRLLPEWLGEAHLRAQGSNVKKVKFQAVYGSDGGEMCGLTVTGEGEADGGGGKNPPVRMSNGENHANSSRDELMTTVGRLLWQEVWGKFVHGNTWWWQDEACVEECLVFGTYWEYWMIDSVKEEKV